MALPYFKVLVVLCTSEEAGKTVRTNYLPLSKAFFRMENAIHTLRIQNFKSIKDVTLQPRRVNLIIGQPNVGKSNILEAMSLLGGAYVEEGKFMSGLLRYDFIRQLFVDNIILNPIILKTDEDVCFLSTESYNIGIFDYALIDRGSFDIIIEKENSESLSSNLSRISHVLRHLNKSVFETIDRFIWVEVKADGFVGEGTGKASKNPEFQGIGPYSFGRKIKPYIFRRNKMRLQYNDAPFLMPPHGNNLFQVLQTNPALRKEVADMFSQYGLKLTLRMDEQRIELIRQVEEIAYAYPFTSMADTIQRIIFYLAAIESNDDSVLLFEEPEAHSFPVYVSMLGRKIAESHNNQFFVATHSPYLVTEILEQMLPDDNQAGELAIFLAYYEDYQTKVKQLSDEEIRDIRNDSIDVFYNLSRFTPGSNLYA